MASNSFHHYLSKRSDDYAQYGRYMVKNLNKKDLKYRFISYLGDLTIMYMPVLFWDFIILLAGGGIIEFGFLESVMNAVDILTMVSMLVSNAIFMILFKGQSFGKIAMDFKIVDKENRELSNGILIMREVFGKGIPILLFHLFFPYFGLVIFTLINSVFVLFDKQHRSFIDMILKTKIVKLNEKAKKSTFVVPEKEEKKIVPAENKYDLHVYSSFSHDGEMEVEDLFTQAKEMGIQALSICDHNSVKANLIASKVAPLYGITYIPGINIDCSYQGYHVRVLGYGINSNDERFARIEYENLAKERVISLRRIELFEEFTGFKVDIDKMPSSRFQVITPEMIARQILSNSEYRKTRLLAPYLNGSKKDAPIKHFVHDFFSKGAPAYVPIAHPNAKDMISLIISCGGCPVLAHPMYSLGKDLNVLKQLVDEGIQGVELFTPYHTKEDIRYLISFAKRNNLEVSAGSEFHGKGRPKFVLGKTTCPKDVEEVIFRFVEKHKSL